MNQKIEDCSIAEIFTLYEEKRRKILRRLLSRDQISKSEFIELIAPIDYRCTFNMGETRKIYDEDYMCKSCFIANKIFNRSNIAEVLDTSRFSLVKTIMLTNKISNMTMHISPQSLILPTDVNSYVLNIIIEHLLILRNIPCHVIYDIFRCGNKIFKIQDQFEYIDPIDIPCVIPQLLHLYNVLEEIQFFGILRIENLIKIKTPCVIFGKFYPFTLSFNEYSGVSCLFNGLKITTLDDVDLLPIDSSILNVTLYEKGIVTHSIYTFDTLVFNDKLSVILFKERMRIIPKFRFVSFYYIIISLLLNKDMRKYFFNDPFSRILWGMMTKLETVYHLLEIGKTIEDILVKFPLKREILKILTRCVSS